MAWGLLIVAQFAGVRKERKRRERGLLLCDLLHFLRIHLHWYERLRRAVDARLHLPQSVLHIVPAAGSATVAPVL